MAGILAKNMLFDNFFFSLLGNMGKENPTFKKKIKKWRW